MRQLMRTTGQLAVAGGALLAYAYLETKLFTVRHVTVPLLAAGQDNIRILHLSDLHATPHQGRKLAWINSLAQWEPDLVVNTGDTLAHQDAVEPVLAALQPLMDSRPGVFVLGSNDFWAPHLKNPARYLLPDARVKSVSRKPLPWQDMVDFFTQAGWMDADNARGPVQLRDGRVLSIVGTNDAHLDLDRMPGRPPGASPQGATVPDAVAHLGVTHAPYLRVLEAFKADGVQLAIAGHTHGGQLRIPGFGALVTNCDLDRRRASGLHGWPGARPDSPLGRDSMWLHVCAGAGTSPYTPVRFACRPEAVLVTLTQGVSSIDTAQDSRN